MFSIVELSSLTYAPTNAHLESVEIDLRINQNQFRYIHYHGLLV
jgi:hypothetical protein